MNWTFKCHGGVAAALGAALLVLAALTWLPGTLPLPVSGWPMAAIAVLLFPIFVSALVRMFLTRADRHTVWLAFRCLPRKAQMGLAALAMSGVGITVISAAGEGNLQAAEVKDGRYLAFDATPLARGTVEISQGQYQAVLESDQRSMLAIPGVLLISAAYVVLAAGELRRADRYSTPS
ncbi:hypothetical protein [Streptomyces nojiriensis]|uniref:Uncharacterized protein n=1 Tax=Streptomyces nojiriensis TaxID=66374 RepID=A0ABQ3SPS8_9ACTN|nr:hypothetical protein [Streptomyces nojiriensis]QTI43664.1 hypothetical protein JYK04_01426 [Streptomyces nojiriensis]GGR82665.1 hypothetical protein GCM10010205_09120 [Streptomyces nojiriensis]GHI70129.1 hypothetical protein Snoj_40470 [Streptomyces nojiriensis]